MSHELSISTGLTKEEKYAELLPQLAALTEGESDMIACMANMCAALHATFPWLWTGFYRVNGEELVLGPFQGPLACVRIRHGRGVCGTAWAESRIVVVPDVEQFPGHIACSSLSRSEIVVPVRGPGGEVTAVLDIDSADTGAFDETDVRWLEKAADLLTDCK